MVNDYLMVDGRRYVYHHTSLFRGYVSRKGSDQDEPKPYKGKFGRGYIVDSCNYNSTNYSFRTYFIEEGGNEK